MVIYDLAVPHLHGTITVLSAIETNAASPQMTMPRFGIGVAIRGREDIDKRAAVFMASDVVRVHAAGVEGAGVTNSAARHCKQIEKLN